MARIGDRLLVQPIENEAVVIMDESSGEEVVIPMTKVPGVVAALNAFFSVALIAGGGLDG